MIEKLIVHCLCNREDLNDQNDDLVVFFFFWNDQKKHDRLCLCFIFYTDSVRGNFGLHNLRLVHWLWLQSKPTVSQWRLLSYLDCSVCEFLHSFLPREKQKIGIKAARDFPCDSIIKHILCYMYDELVWIECKIF